MASDDAIFNDNPPPSWLATNIAITSQKHLSIVGPPIFTELLRTALTA